MTDKIEIEYLPGYPPDDYKGSVSDWMVELQMRGLWDGEGWYGDVEVPKDVWWDMLEKLEKE